MHWLRFCTDSLLGLRRRLISHLALIHFIPSPTSGRTRTAGSSSARPSSPQIRRKCQRADDARPSSNIRTAWRSVRYHLGQCSLQRCIANPISCRHTSAHESLGVHIKQKHRPAGRPVARSGRQSSAADSGSGSCISMWTVVHAIQCF